ncbi:MAG: molecular chaperone TorD family protein [Planctomycetota bacterium]|nr:molecular chaperone TorD family protein [Planctomycetota bacterium]
MSSSEERSARSGLYRLLARLWLREIDGPFLERLGSGSLGGAFAEAGGVLPTLVTGEQVEALEVEFCRLFLGPSKHFPPYQSVWQAGQLEGEACRSVRDFAAVVHYDIDAAAPGVMVDHLAVQLGLMGHVLGTDMGGPAEVVDEWEALFFASHLQWPEPLLVGVMERVESEFYASMISLTRAFLQSESPS